MKRRLITLFVAADGEIQPSAFFGSSRPLATQDLNIGSYVTTLVGQD